LYLFRETERAVESLLHRPSSGVALIACSGSLFLLLRERNLVPVRRFHSEQVMNEVVVAIMFRIQNADTMILTGDVQHVEVLVSFHER